MATQESALVFEVHSGLSGLLSIEHQWNELAQASGANFLHFPAWYRAELEGAGQDLSVYFVCARSRDDNRLLGVIPLERTYLAFKSFRVPILQLYYKSEMGLNDCLTAGITASVKPRLLKFLRAELPYFVFVRWQCILANGNVDKLFGLGNQVRLTHNSKFLDISQGFEAFWAGYSSKFRKGLQKKHNQLAKEGELQLRQYHGRDAIDEGYQVFLALEDSGWKGEKGSSIRAQPAKAAYYDRLKRYFLAENVLRINVLYCGDQPVAAQFGVLVRRELYLLKIAYDETFKKYSPGYLILYELCLGQQTFGLDKISFVTGVSWIDRWHPAEAPVGIAYSSNGTALGALAVASLRNLVRARKAIKRKRKSQAN